MEGLIKRLFEEKIEGFIVEVRNEELRRTNSEHLSFRKMIPQLKAKPEELEKIKSVSLCFDLKEMQELIDERDKLVEEHLKGNKTKKNK